MQFAPLRTSQCRPAKTYRTHRILRFCPTCTQVEVCADRRLAKYKHPVNSV